MSTYYHTQLFFDDCVAIYERLSTCERITGVWLIAGCVACHDGIGFRWQGRTFRINWYNHRWQVRGRKRLFVSQNRQDLIEFCLNLASIHAN